MKKKKVFQSRNKASFGPTGSRQRFQKQHCRAACVDEHCSCANCEQTARARRARETCLHLLPRCAGFDESDQDGIPPPPPAPPPAAGSAGSFFRTITIQITDSSNKTNKRRTARAMVNSNAPYYLSVCGIFVPVCLVSTVIFLLRRNVQPIKARLPWVVAAQALMLASHNGALGLGFSADGPRICWVQNLVGHVCFIGLAFIYTCRAWNLHLQHYLTGSAKALPLFRWTRLPPVLTLALSSTPCPSSYHAQRTSLL
jgi:hypothetical protein